MKPKKTGYQKTLEFLKKYEGFKDTVYLDGNGIPTIGYGFTDPSLIKKGYISRADADKHLEQEVRTIEKELRSKVKGWENLTDDSKTALLSYRFNYPAGFKDTTRFMLNWNAGDYSAAIKEVDAGMNDENNPGLRKRRLAEQALLNADPYLQGAKTQVTDNGKKMTFPRGYWDIHQYESTYQLPKQTNTVYPLNPNDRTVPSLDAWNGADSPSAGPNMPSLLKSMDERKRMFDLFSDNAVALGKKKTLPNLRNVLDRKMEDYVAGIIGVPDVYEEPGYTYTPMMYSPMPVFADGKPAKNDSDYLNFLKQLPDNQRLSNNYPTRRYWELNGKPKTFGEAIGKGMYTIQNDDGQLNWHAGSIAYNEDTDEYEFMKSNMHPTRWMELVYGYDTNPEFLKDWKVQYNGPTGNDKYVRREKLGLNVNRKGFVDGKLPKYRGGRGSVLDDVVLAYDKFVEDNPYHIATAMSYLPFIGTAMDIREAVKNPTAENIGYAGLSGLTDLVGGRIFAKVAGNILKAKKMAKAVKKAELDHWRNTPFYLNMPKQLAEHTVKYYAKRAADEVLDAANATGEFMPEVRLIPAASVYFPDFIANVNLQRDKQLPGHKDGKSPIRIKPENRGKLTRLKKRTGKSESELYNDGNPAHKKMVVFARNARKWSHKR